MTARIQISLLSLCLLFLQQGMAQSINDSISEADAEKHLSFLASDELKGRVNHTTEQLEAARYLVAAFRRYGLAAPAEYADYVQPFHVQRAAGDSSSHPYRTDTLQTTALYNIIGVLPGKSRPGESIIISAHYDHVNADVFGNRKAGVFNGANDNASGTTAVLLLARYFALRNDNERTIIFCLFAGEELGLLGSTHLAGMLEPDSIMVMINIEMIGRVNRTGPAAFFVTGSHHSDLEAILKKNLKRKSLVKVRKEGPDNANLFMRSDNLPFARKGVPAHSIMCSDDHEPCYHQPCDDVKKIDIKNMVMVIRAIAIGCSTLISGKDTPRRLK